MTVNNPDITVLDGKNHQEVGTMTELFRPSRRAVLGGAMAAAGGALLGGAALTTARPALAAASMPRVYTTSEWSARPPNGTISVVNHGPDHLVVHHMDSPNTTDYSLSAAYAIAHWCQNLHMDTNGWIDTGQQLSISRGGYVLEGRHQSLSAIAAHHHVVGAQTANQNSHTLGIENEGTYISVAPTTALLNSLVATLAWLCAWYKLDPHEAIVGHRDYVTTTECPGDVLYGMLPSIRDQVAAAMGI
jgi:hypothetical protein